MVFKDSIITISCLMWNVGITVITGINIITIFTIIIKNLVLEKMGIMGIK